MAIFKSVYRLRDLLHIFEFCLTLGNKIDLSKLVVFTHSTIDAINHMVDNEKDGILK